MRPLNLLISAHQGIWWWGYIDDKSNHQPRFIKWPAMPGLVLSTWHDYHSVLKAAERANTITHSLQMRLHEVNLPKVPQSLTRRSEKQTLSPLFPSLVGPPSHHNASWVRDGLTNPETQPACPPHFCRQVTEESLAEHVSYKMLRQGKTLITLQLLIKRAKRGPGKHASSYRWPRVERWLHSVLSDLTSPSFSFAHP